jgi:transcriptional regulator with XRE-family HTH domain
MSQAELAQRLDTKQPVVARWETGQRSPDYDTVVRAVAACGFEMEPLLSPSDHQTDAQIRRWLDMTPDERIDLNQELIETEAWAHSARTVRKLVDR